MTYEEIKAEAESAARRIAGTRRGILVWNKDLVTLLMDAYAQGFKSGVDHTVSQFAPTLISHYEQLRKKS